MPFSCAMIGTTTARRGRRLTVREVPVAVAPLGWGRPVRTRPAGDGLLAPRSPFRLADAGATGR